MSSTIPPIPPHPADNPDASTLEMLRGLMQEAAGYARDLLQLAIAELKEQSRSMKMLLGLGATAVLFLLFSFCWLSLALVGVISYGLNSWRWALLIVGVGYAIIGLLLLIPVAHGLKGAIPTLEHTRRRIEEDTKYLKNKLAA